MTTPSYLDEEFQELSRRKRARWSVAFQEKKRTVFVKRKNNVTISTHIKRRRKERGAVKDGGGKINGVQELVATTKFSSDCDETGVVDLCLKQDTNTR